MPQLNIEQRLKNIDENVAAIRRMLEELMNKQAIESIARNQNEILNVKQVAQFLGLDPNIIYSKCAKADIPFFKIGKQYRFKKSDILKWMEESNIASSLSVDEYVNKYLQSHILKS